MEFPFTQHQGDVTEEKEHPLVLEAPSRDFLRHHRESQEQDAQQQEVAKNHAPHYQTVRPVISSHHGS